MCMANLDEVVRQLREAKDRSGETNRSIAEKSGVPLSSVAKFFSGASQNPSFVMIAAFAEALGLSLDALAGLPTAEAAPEEPGIPQAEAIALQHRLEAAEQELAYTKLYASRLEAGLAERKPVIYGLAGLSIFLALAFVAYIVIDINDPDHGLIRAGSGISPLLYLLLLGITSALLATAHFMVKHKNKHKEAAHALHQV